MKSILFDRLSFITALQRSMICGFDVQMTINWQIIQINMKVSRPICIYSTSTYGTRLWVGSDWADQRGTWSYSYTLELVLSWRNNNKTISSFYVSHSRLVDQINAPTLGSRHNTWMTQGYILLMTRAFFWSHFSGSVKGSDEEESWMASVLGHRIDSPFSLCACVMRS